MEQAGSVELDYALPAHFAKVNGDGTITIVDGSLLQVEVAPGSAVPYAVAARVRFLGGRLSTQLGLHVVAGRGTTQQEMTVTVPLDASKSAVYGDGRRHVILAFNSLLSDFGGGEVTVELSLDGSLVRTLKFSVVVRD